MNSKTEIIPAIMPESFHDLREKAEKVFRLVSELQIDVMDGKFVSSVNWPYINNINNNFKELIKEAGGLPFGEDVDYEIDLMVSNPLKDSKEWITSGAKRIIVHIESVSPEKLAEIIKYTKEKKVEIFLAIGMGTPNEKLDKWLEDVDGVQFMGIAKIGFQGENFDERVLEKISSLREKFSKVTISVDGGVGLDNAQRLVEAGANKLVSGSAIFESDNVKEAIEKLKGN